MREEDCGTKIIVRCEEEMEQTLNIKPEDILQNIQKSPQPTEDLNDISLFNEKKDLSIKDILQRIKKEKDIL